MFHINLYNMLHMCLHHWITCFIEQLLQYETYNGAYVLNI